MVNKVLRNTLLIMDTSHVLIWGGAQGGYMIEGNALRHQMVLPQQQKIYDYWRSKCQIGQFPSRQDIRPEDIGKQLTTTSITEVNDNTGRYRIRLAGTGFWNLFNGEIQGRYVDELPIGCRADYWKNVLDRVVKNKRPYAGVTRPGTPCGGHLAQFWIRLPLADDGQNVSMILGYDHFVKMNTVAPEVETVNKIFA